MSLQIWLPLNNDIKNYGTDHNVVFSNRVEATSISGGKVTKNCYYFTPEGHDRGTDYGLYTTNSGSLATYFNDHSWTMAFWIKTGVSIQSDVFCISGPDSEKNYETRCYIAGEADVGRFVFEVKDGNTYRYPSTDDIAVNDSNWHHITIAYDYNKNKFYCYCDGVLKTAPQLTNGTFNKNITGISIGRNYAGNIWFDGFINDFRIYDHALSSEEVLELSQGLVAHYSFNWEEFYQPIEYIESTGTQYIDTDIKFNTGNTYELRSKIEFDNVTEPNQIIGYDGHAGNGIGTSTNTWWLDNAASVSCSTNTIYDIIWTRSDTSWTRTINGTSYSGSAQIGSQTYNIPIYLFATRKPDATPAYSIGYWCYMKMYYCKLYENILLFVILFL